MTNGRRTTAFGPCRSGSGRWRRTGGRGEAEMKGGRIFVTGGTGFFGKSLLDRMLRGFGAEWRLLVLSRDPGRFLAENPQFAGLGGRLEWMRGDVRGFAFPPKMPAVDAVIHAGTPALACRGAYAVRWESLRTTDGVGRGHSHHLDGSACPLWSRRSLLQERWNRAQVGGCDSGGQQFSSAITLGLLQEAAETLEKARIRKVQRVPGRRLTDVGRLEMRSPIVASVSKYKGRVEIC